MGLLFYSAVAWVIGKIAHISILEKLGYYGLIISVVVWGLGFIGISIPLPIGI